MVAISCDTYDFLLGSWSVTRELFILASQDHGCFSGVALVATYGEPSRALYRERGTISRGSYSGPAQRELHYQRLTSGGVTASFADGRPFIEFDLRSGRATQGYGCGNDLYTISIEVRSPSEWQETWDVTGPSKQYSALTIYTRFPDDHD